MGEIRKCHYIDENSLDKGFYFQDLFQILCSKKYLEETTVLRIQMELVELLTKQVERYTNDESSSVPIETAQQLLQSITYCLGAYLKVIPDMEQRVNLLKTEAISGLFYKGMEEIVSKVKEAQTLLLKLQKDKIKLELYAYTDTLLTGLPLFFHDYNIEFAAFDLPGSIDYPLCNDISNLLGIEYIYEYLNRINLEHNYIKLYAEDEVARLLQAYHTDSKQLLVNIFELVFINSLGVKLTGGYKNSLNITKEDRDWIGNKLLSWKVEEIQSELSSLVLELSNEYQIPKEITDYMNTCLPSIAVRIKNALITDTLDHVFLTLPREEVTLSVRYEVGQSMEDEQLRDLIEVLRECKTVEDKISLIQNKVRSLEDLLDLFDMCFYEEEFQEVFSMLNDTELSMIKERIEEEIEFDGVKDHNELKLWQKECLRYVDHISSQRTAK